MSPEAAAGRGRGARRGPRRPARDPAQPVEPGHQGCDRRRRGADGRPAVTGHGRGGGRGRHRPGGRHHPSRRGRPANEPRPRLRRVGASRPRTRSSTCPRSRASGRRATTSPGRRGDADRRLRRAHRRPDLLGQQPSGGGAPARGPGRDRVVNPRATEERTYQRWKTVLRANALTSCCYVLRVNRPHPEGGVLIGGPSMAVDPNGEVLVETTDTLALVTLDAKVVTDARRAYPGYLPVSRAPVRRCLGRSRPTRRLS